jgi:hypothetical protein
MRVLILIISSDNLPTYKNNKQVWLSYMNAHPSIDAYFIEYRGDIGDDQEIIQENHTLYFKGEESFANILAKTYYSFHYFINQTETKYDFFVRTNLSTVCDLNALMHFLEGLPSKERIYSGVKMPFYNLESLDYWFNFVSGMGIVLSRDVVEILLDPKHHPLLQTVCHMDDVDIGYCLNTLEIPILPLKECVVGSVACLQEKEQIIKERTHIFYRVKFAHFREIEADCMNIIVKWLYVYPQHITS